MIDSLKNALAQAVQILWLDFIRKQTNKVKWLAHVLTASLRRTWDWNQISWFQGVWFSYGQYHICNKLKAISFTYKISCDPRMTLQGRASRYYYLHLPDQEVEAQRNW